MLTEELREMARRAIADLSDDEAELALWVLVDVHAEKESLSVAELVERVFLEAGHSPERARELTAAVLAEDIDLRRSLT